MHDAFSALSEVWRLHYVDAMSQSPHANTMMHPHIALYCKKWTHFPLLTLSGNDNKPIPWVTLRHSQSNFFPKISKLLFFLISFFPKSFLVLSHHFFSSFFFFFCNFLQLWVTPPLHEHRRVDESVHLCVCMCVCFNVTLTQFFHCELNSCLKCY